MPDYLSYCGIVIPLASACRARRDLQDSRGIPEGAQLHSLCRGAAGDSGSSEASSWFPWKWIVGCHMASLGLGLTAENRGAALCAFNLAGNPPSTSRTLCAALPGTNRADRASFVALFFCLALVTVGDGFVLAATWVGIPWCGRGSAL
jgi:hypothetical protein